MIRVLCVMRLPNGYQLLLRAKMGKPFCPEGGRFMLEAVQQRKHSSASHALQVVCTCIAADRLTSRQATSTWLLSFMMPIRLPDHTTQKAGASGSVLGSGFHRLIKKYMELLFCKIKGGPYMYIRMRMCLRYLLGFRHMSAAQRLR